MTDEVAFKDLGNKDIPDKGNIREEKVEEDIGKKIFKEEKEKEIRGETGTEPPAKGSFTKDVPQLAFRIVSELIPCPKFQLSDDEAKTMATHMNILLPLEGKLASVVVILMITLNKVFTCLDAIRARSKPKMVNDEAGLPVKEDYKPVRVNEVIK